MGAVKVINYEGVFCIFYFAVINSDDFCLRGINEVSYSYNIAI